jgi:hypothetical protein
MNTKPESIAEALYNILSEKLNANLIQKEKDIISIIDTQKNQIKGMITPEGTDNYRIVFEDQSLLTITLLGGDRDTFTEIEMTHGYFVPNEMRQ